MSLTELPKNAEKVGNKGTTMYWYDKENNVWYTLVTGTGYYGGGSISRYIEVRNKSELKEIKAHFKDELIAKGITEER